MKKPTIIGIVLIVLVIAVGAYMYFQSSPSTQPAPAEQTNTQQPAIVPNETSTKASIEILQATQQTPGTSETAAPVAVTQETTATTTTPVTLTIGTDKTLGKYLTAPNGMTLYTFSNDALGKSNCTGDCAKNWPPYIINSFSDLKTAAEPAGIVGTITRTEGTLQVTYNGIPLYFWNKDTKAGNTTGNGVGGLWTVAKP
jgi:predicted lipoprotein with Yx(FWY)xxD motif